MVCLVFNVAFGVGCDGFDVGFDRFVVSLGLVLTGLSHFLALPFGSGLVFLAALEVTGFMAPIKTTTQN